MRTQVLYIPDSLDFAVAIALILLTAWIVIITTTPVIKTLDNTFQAIRVKLRARRFAKIYRLNHKHIVIRDLGTVRHARQDRSDVGTPGSM